MARIAEDLLLLLLDNATAKPALEKSGRQRLLAGAVLLDLAYSWRIRPSAAEDPAPEGLLITLAGPDDGDPIQDWAWNALHRKPISAKDAIAKLHRNVEAKLLAHLERTGQLRRTPLYGKRFRPEYVWLLPDRTRATQIRSTLLTALLEEQEPDPPTAAVCTLLYTVGGLGELISLDARGREWVHHRAGEIASGSWIAADSDLAEVNLAVTAAAVCAALK